MRTRERHRAVTTGGTRNDVNEGWERLAGVIDMLVMISSILRLIIRSMVISRDVSCDFLEPGCALKRHSLT